MKRKKKDPPAVDPRKVAALIAALRDSDRVRDVLRSEYALDDQETENAIKAGRDSLALAADVDARLEFAARREQLEDLRARARDANDLKTELDVLRELSKLCDLYRAASVADEKSAAESADAALVREHLEALPFVPQGLPIEELARLVAAHWLNSPASDDSPKRKKKPPRT